MPFAVRRRSAALLAGALLLAAPLAHADWVATEEEERAYLAKMKRGVPPTVAQVVKAFPGATFDAECSLRAWGGDADAYAFRARATREAVERHLQESAPDAALGAVAVYGTDWCTSGSGTVDYVVRVWPPQKAAKLKAAAEARRTGIAQLTANPPAPDSLGLPLPGDAVYDPACSYDVDLERKRRYADRYDSVACYSVEATTYAAAVTSLRALGVRPGSIENNVQPEIRDEHVPMKVAYWVGRGGPTRSLAEWRAANAPAGASASAAASTNAAASPNAAASSSAAASPAAAPATPAPEKPNAANTAKEAVRKLKGLFDR